MALLFLHNEIPTYSLHAWLPDIILGVIPLDIGLSIQIFLTTLGSSRDPTFWLYHRAIPLLTISGFAPTSNFTIFVLFFV